MTRLLLVGALLGACARRDRPAPPAEAGAPPPVAQSELRLARSDARDPDELAPEDREANPVSETVTIRLTVTPPTRAVVTWGRKRLAELTPGQMRVDLQRPRNSGPLDVVVKADGFLPHHARLFTDRDDKLAIRLVRPSEAGGLLGYRPPVEAPR